LIRRLKLCGVIFAILAIAGMSYGIHYQIHKPQYLGIDYSRARKCYFEGYGQWSIQDGQPQFVQLVIVPRATHHLGAHISNSPRAKPSGSRKGGGHVDLIPSGIYVNGVRVPATADQRLFIMNSDYSLMPIPLTAEEMAGFTPAFVDQRFQSTSLWRDRIRPLVEPELIAQEQFHAALAQEANGLADEKKRGIKRSRIYAGHCNEQGKRVRDLYYVSDWLKHPQGQWTHLNTFIGRIDSFEYCPWPTGETSLAFNPNRKPNHERMTKGHLTVLDIFPGSYEIDGEAAERGKAYVQRLDGSATVLELTPEESQQFTGELLSSADRFVASDLYIRKIAPLLEEPVSESKTDTVAPVAP
jgi:hypothetical protein